jgi:hypothetical protein
MSAHGGANGEFPHAGAPHEGRVAGVAAHLLV